MCLKVQITNKWTAAINSESKSRVSRNKFLIYVQKQLSRSHQSFWKSFRQRSSRKCRRDAAFFREKVLSFPWIQHQRFLLRRNWRTRKRSALSQNESASLNERGMGLHLEKEFKFLEGGRPWFLAAWSTGGLLHPQGQDSGSILHWICCWCCGK